MNTSVAHIAPGAVPGDRIHTRRRGIERFRTGYSHRLASFVGLMLVSGVFVRPAIAGPVVQSVRHWSAPEYTRIVFDMSARPIYRHSLTAADPPSLVLELDRTTFAASISSFAVGDGRVERVRVLPIPVEGGLTQVLIELTERRETRVFVLAADRSKPHRLVVDVLRSDSDPVGNGPTGGVESAPSGESPNAQPEELHSQPVVPPPQTAPQERQRETQAPAPRAPATSRAKPGPRTWTIVIDPGHGGDDPGARGPRGLLEKDVCLALSKSLAAELNRRPGIKAVLTRDNDTFLTLRRRTRLAAEKKADLFVSVHANANRNRKVYGTEVYFLSLRGASDAEARELAMRENAADQVAGVPPDSQDDIENILVDLMRTATLERSSELAATVIEHVRGDQRLFIRGVKQAGFDVLKTAGMPSILIEAAFISHPKEAKLLKAREFQKQFASNVATGIVAYLSRAAMAEAPAAAADPAAPPPVPATSPPAGS